MLDNKAFTTTKGYFKKHCWRPLGLVVLSFHMNTKKWPCVFSPPQSVADVPGRQLVHDGDLVELDAESHAQLQRVHAFLLNDSLMIATWIPNRWETRKGRFALHL